MMVWNARIYFIHGRKILEMLEAFPLTYEYQLIRILSIYIINSVDIIFGFYDLLKPSIAYGNRYFSLKTFFRKLGGGQDYRESRGRNKHFSFLGLVELKTCTDIAIMF